MATGSPTSQTPAPPSVDAIIDSASTGGLDGTSSSCNNDNVVAVETSGLTSDGEREKSLEYAEELMDRGFKANKEEDYVEATDCFSRALEIRNEIKRDGAGCGNWGSHADEITLYTFLPYIFFEYIYIIVSELVNFTMLFTNDTEEVVNEGEKIVEPEKSVTEGESKDEKKENVANESEEKEPEDKEMTLEEYQKVLEGKRKALKALKTEERKVEVDKDLAAMQQLSNKKSSDEIFVKLGTDKDKRKEIAEKEEKAKKSLSINEFLKPAAGERGYNSGGRGHGRGGSRGGGGGGRYNQGDSSYAPEAPNIFPPPHE